MPDTLDSVIDTLECSEGDILSHADIKRLTTALKHTRTELQKLRIVRGRLCRALARYHMPTDELLSLLE